LTAGSSLLILAMPLLSVAPCHSCLPSQARIVTWAFATGFALSSVVTQTMDQWAPR
jgi:hypothetical protein